MPALNSLIVELECAVQSGSVAQRVATMRRVTDLFVSNAEALSDEQIGLFDDVLLRIVRWVENRALDELSRRLAPVRNAPVGVIQRLARHDDIAVAGPVLSQSERLTASDLIEIARKKGEDHQLAISDRKMLVEAVTDVLLERGTSNVFCKLASNAGAAFSSAGFQALIDRARDDATLAENIGRRIDVPRPMLDKLVATATHAVRIKLQAAAPREFHADIDSTLARVSRSVIDEAGSERADPVDAEAFVLALQRQGQLNEPSLRQFAKNHEFDKLAAALALMTATRFALIDRLIRTAHYGSMLVACKAAGLKWESVDIILTSRHPNHPISAADLTQARVDYADLTKMTAVRLLGFWQAEADVQTH